MILEELDSVAIRWVRQESLLGATLIKKKKQKENKVLLS